MSDIQTLIDMGFPKEKAERALEVTNNKGVEQAMEWLLAHADEPLPPSTTAAAAPGPAGDSSSSTAAETTDTPAGGSTDDQSAAAVAKSLKCDECGKLFKSQEEVEFHAAKTEHSSFSESTEEKKPLTEEEKKAQLALLEEKMRRKRQEREENEKKEAMERERLRIKSGKDMLEARRKMEEQEMKKLMDQRKREKLESQQARDRVRAQIEADRAARKAKDSGETTAVSPTSTTNSPPPPVAAATSKPTSTTPSKPAETKSYTTAKIAIRMMDGTQLVQTFQAGEQLAAVRLFVQLKMDSIDAAFGLMTNFPKKVFSAEEYDMPLDKLGLVPNAVLIVTKAP